MVLWVLRVVLAALFIWVGLAKFPGGEGSMWVEVFGVIGLGQWFRYVTGAVEAAGGALLLWPRATWAAVLLLAPTMVGAFLTHVLFFQVGGQSLMVAALLAGVLAVGWLHRGK